MKARYPQPGGAPARRSARRLALFAAAMGLLSAACSSTSGSTTSPSSASSGSSTTAPNGRPVASGSVTSVSGSSMNVQSRLSGTTSVTWTSATAFTQTVPVTAQDVAGSEEHTSELQSLTNLVCRL